MIKTLLPKRMKKNLMKWATVVYILVNETSSFWMYRDSFAGMKFEACTSTADGILC